MDEKWTKKEKIIAKAAYDMAYLRECAELKAFIAAAKPSSDEELWKFCDTLEEWRKEIIRKFDYRYSTLIFLLARLINEGYLSLNELAGLAPDKIDFLTQMTQTALSTD